MIADTILQCVYNVVVTGDVCHTIIPESAELGINRIQINSSLFNNDIEAYNALSKCVDAIKASAGPVIDELTEFNPEFYPSLNTGNLSFDVTSTITPTDRGTELITTQASKVFDPQGDFKNIRTHVKYANGTLAGNVISDPLKYLTLKQEADLSSEMFFCKKTRSVEVH